MRCQAMRFKNCRQPRLLIWPVLMVCGIGGVAGAAALDDARSLVTQKNLDGAGAG